MDVAHALAYLEDKRIMPFFQEVLKSEEKRLGMPVFKLMATQLLIKVGEASLIFPPHRTAKRREKREEAICEGWRHFY